MSTFCHSTVSTGRISSLPLSMIGQTLETLSSTWTRTRRSPVLAWYCRYHSHHRMIIDPELYSKLREVAEGLRYLHSYGVVHGDLKGVSPHRPLPNLSSIRSIPGTLQSSDRMLTFQTDKRVDFSKWTRAPFRLWFDAYTIQPRLYGRCHTWGRRHFQMAGSRAYQPTTQEGVSITSRHKTGRYLRVRDVGHRGLHRRAAIW